MEELHFISVNFNNSCETEKLLVSLEHQKWEADQSIIRCIIVDNSTVEKEASRCEELVKRSTLATYLRAPRNLGYFGGLNYGIAAAKCAAARYVIICNNDLQFDQEFCERLLRSRYEERVFAVCPDVVTEDGLHQNPHLLKKIGTFRRLQLDLYFSHYCISRLLIMILRIIRPVKSSPPQPKEGCELHMGVGACYVLTSGFLKRARSLNYPFFLYGEEAYISNQIHSEGGILWFDPHLHVRHAESAALSKVPNRTAYEFARVGYPSYKKLL